MPENPRTPLRPGGPPTVETLSARLGHVEAFQGQAQQALNLLTDTLVSLRDKEVTALKQKVAELEMQIMVDQTCRNLAEISAMHPKERIVIFVSSTSFSDNIKYAWQHFVQAPETKGVECWFLPQDARQMEFALKCGGRSFPVRPEDWSAEDVHRAFAAAVVVLKDHFLSPNPLTPALLAGARLVQMWHGVSIKEIGLRNLKPLKYMSPHNSRILRTCGDFSHFVGTAAHHLDEWRRWFAFERYTATGYPRNDVLLRTPTPLDLLNVDRKAFDLAGDALARGKPVYLYAPTFREANFGNWLLDVGIGPVARELASRGARFFVNLHPIEHHLIPKLSKALPELVFVEPGTDVYPLLPRTTALITDYSSIMFDYLMLDRPIVLFRPDHLKYTTESRQLFDAKLAIPPGPLVGTAADLLRILGQTDLHAPVRSELRNTLFDAHDAGSAARVTRVILDELEHALERP